MLGAVATRDIGKGEVVIKEKPLFTFYRTKTAVALDANFRPIET